MAARGKANGYSSRRLKQLSSKQSHKKVKELTTQQATRAYKIWKEKCPFLYDLIMVHKMPTPNAISLQWIDGTQASSDDKNTIRHRLLVTSERGNRKKTDLVILGVKDIEQNIGDMHDEGKRPIVEGEQSIATDFKIVHAAAMPQNQRIIAAQCRTNEFPQTQIYRFSEFKGSTSNAKGRYRTSSQKPLLKLIDADNVGDRLSWNRKQEGQLLTCGKNRICLWNLEKHESIDESKKSGSSYQTNKYSGHCGLVNDVEWSPHDVFHFSTAGEDGLFLMWDSRNRMAQSTTRVSKSSLCRVTYNLQDKHKVATSGQDGIVRIWDTRKLEGQPIHELEWHQGEVSQIAWAPFSPDALLTAGEDRRVAVWDLKRAGKKLAEEEAKEGPSELLFVHGGHMASIVGVGWNEDRDWTCVSASKNGRIHFWAMSQFLYDDDFCKKLYKRAKKSVKRLFKPNDIIASAKRSKVNE